MQLSVKQEPCKVVFDRGEELASDEAVFIRLNLDTDRVEADSYAEISQAIVFESYVQIDDPAPVVIDGNPEELDALFEKELLCKSKAGVRLQSIQKAHDPHTAGNGSEGRDRSSQWSVAVISVRKGGSGIGCPMCSYPTFRRLHTVGWSGLWGVSCA